MVDRKTTTTRPYTELANELVHRSGGRRMITRAGWGTPPTPVRFYSRHNDSSSTIHNASCTIDRMTYEKATPRAGSIAVGRNLSEIDERNYLKMDDKHCWSGVSWKHCSSRWLELYTLCYASSTQTAGRVDDSHP